VFALGGTVATLSAVNPTPAWLGTAKLTWTLTDDEGRYLLGETAALERSIDSGLTWKTVKDVTVESSEPAVVIATDDFRRRTWYRLRYAGDALNSPTTSPTAMIAPRVSLTRPSARTALSADVRFTSIGYLEPRHPAGQRTIRIKCYKKIGGVWRLKKTVRAVNLNYRTYTKYRARFALPSRGYWKLLAYHPSDALHAATLSRPRYVTER
jgi:hypothetical protein